MAEAAIHEEEAPVFQSWAREFYEQLEEPPAVFRALAALPFIHVVNTAPGLNVDLAFKSEKERTIVDYYDRTARVHPSFDDPSSDAPLVYNLFGSLERPTSLVLSERHRHDFLVSVIRGDPPLPAKLLGAFRLAPRRRVRQGSD